ncbi:hypothetical protein AKJ16_DCAP24893 [Drosera capensis]
MNLKLPPKTAAAPSGSPASQRFHKLHPLPSLSGSLESTCRSMSTAVNRTSCAPPTVRPVTIRFSDLQDKSADLTGLIEEGFGPKGLGILSVSHVRRV